MSTGSGNTNDQIKSTAATLFSSQRRRRWVAKSAASESVDKYSSDLIWFFNIGLHSSISKLCTQSKLVISEEVPGKLDGWRLTFNHKGGLGNLEPAGEGENGGYASVHGMLLLLRKHDLELISKLEREYKSINVEVMAYDARVIEAHVLISQPHWKLNVELAPHASYLKALLSECARMNLDFEYQSRLQSWSFIKGERGAEYWCVIGDSAYQKKQQERRTEKQRREERMQAADNSTTHGPLHLRACTEFAVSPLVDIGANLGKCKPQDLAEQLVRAAASQVDHLVLTGCSVKGSKDAQRICDEWHRDAGWDLLRKHLGKAALEEVQASILTSLPSLAFTAGVHPHEAKLCNGDTLQELSDLAKDARCVAIGECGLDYDRMFSPREVQLEWCRKQVCLAVDLGMPLFMHERDRDASKGPALGSQRDLMEILVSCRTEPSRVCIHCFTGSEQDLEVYIKSGFYIGLTGFVGMRQRGSHIRELLQKDVLPLNQLMLETDCPFMMPDKFYLPSEVGIQGRRNEPCAMPAVCRAIAECFRESPEQVAAITTANAKKFFGL